jgi:hypothetical protein
LGVLGSRFNAVLIALGAMACGREAVPANVPADVSGTYVYVGADTTGRIPWAARAELDLAADSTFEFDLRIHIQDENERETKTGTYRISGDRLLLNVDGKESDDFHLAIRGDSLIFETGWAAMAALRLVGAPRPVLVRGR